ncbi:MAG: hypothetical protein ABI193_10915 [Minicystis sp.]
MSALQGFTLRRGTPGSGPISRSGASCHHLSFNAVNEIFLAQCLGGRYQPIGDDFKGSTIAVPAGADQIFSLGEALSRK